MRKPHTFFYLRNAIKLAARVALGNCVLKLDVLAWMIDKINSNRDDSGNNLMAACVQLAHARLEGGFSNSDTGGCSLIDDDDIIINNSAHSEPKI